jgi:hypothetical protein
MSNSFNLTKGEILKMMEVLALSPIVDTLNDWEAEFLGTLISYACSNNGFNRISLKQEAILTAIYSSHAIRSSFLKSKVGITYMKKIKKKAPASKKSDQSIEKEDENDRAF